MHKMLDRVMPGLVLEDGHDVVYVILCYGQDWPSHSNIDHLQFHL